MAIGPFAMIIVLQSMRFSGEFFISSAAFGDHRITQELKNIGEIMTSIILHILIKIWDTLVLVLNIW